MGNSNGPTIASGDSHFDLLNGKEMRRLTDSKLVQFMANIDSNTNGPTNAVGLIVWSGKIFKAVDRGFLQVRVPEL